MKIQDIQHSQHAVASKSQAAVSANNFQALLDSKLQSVVPVAESVLAVEPATGSAAVPPALRIDSLNLAEETMATLEHFESALQNRHFQASELEPLVANLELNTAAILDLKQQLPAGDPLHRLVDRVAAVAYVEAYKFRRGDYAA